MDTPADDATDILPIVRTNNAQAQTRALIERLEAVFPVSPLVVFDDRQGKLDFGDYASLGVNEALFSDLGFKNLPKNWGWFCGDFWYYAAFDHAPGHRLYMLLDDDVYMSEAAMKLLRDKLKSFAGDAAASRLSDTYSEPPKYSRALSDLGRASAVGCIFPLTVASPATLAAMRLLRQDALRENAAINDEAVFASAAFTENLACAALETLLPEQFAPDAFNTNPPHLLEVLQSDPQGDKVWHPVVSFEKVLERIATGEKNYSRHRLRKILKTAPRHMKTAIKAAL
jgi:hypothetical protein